MDNLRERGVVIIHWIDRREQLALGDPNTGVYQVMAQTLLTEGKYLEEWMEIHCKVETVESQTAELVHTQKQE